VIKGECAATALVDTHHRENAGVATAESLLAADHDLYRASNTIGKTPIAIIPRPQMAIQ
jgi:hypothetical protein